MKIRSREAVIVAGVLGTGAALWARAESAERQARAAIERLHQLDVETTLSDDADELAKLWDRDAVRIQPGRPAEIGQAVIHAADKRWQAAGRGKVLRVIKRQPDGSWKFARVIGFPEKLESAAPMAHPCE